MNLTTSLTVQIQYIATTFKIIREITVNVFWDLLFFIMNYISKHLFLKLMLVIIVDHMYTQSIPELSYCDLSGLQQTDNAYSLMPIAN